MEDAAKSAWMPRCAQCCEGGEREKRWLAEPYILRLGMHDLLDDGCPSRAVGTSLSLVAGLASYLLIR